MITRKQLEELQKAGKIRGFQDNKPMSPTSMSASPKKGSKTKEWILLHLRAWAGANRWELTTEHRFHPERKWRFDFAFPEKKIAIEYEGLISEKSRHTTISGFTGDTEKYNAAQQLGWMVFRYTPKNYKSMITDLNKLL
jgi:hypothetical protein